MKRRKGKTRQSSSRSQSIRLMLERLETRQLLAGFVSIAVPGAVETGTVDFIESAAHVNVKVADSSCVASKASEDGESDSTRCNANNDSGVVGNVVYSRFLSVGDGFGLKLRAPSNYDSPTTDPTTVEVSADPEPTTVDPITIVTEEVATDSDPVGQPSPLDPDVGVYFPEPDPIVDDLTSDTSTTTSTTDTTTTGEPRIAALERVQMFALLLPSDLPKPGLPAVEDPMVSNPLPQPFTPASAEVDSAFEDIDEEIFYPSPEAEGFQPTFDLPELNIVGPDVNSSEPVRLKSPVSEPATINHLALPALDSLPDVPLNVLDEVLESMTVEESDTEEVSIPKEDVPVKPASSDDESDVESEELVEGIYLVEGVILITALPSSLLCRRDDESEDRFSV